MTLKKMGIEGESPETVDAKSILPRADKIYSNQRIQLNGNRSIVFNPDKHLVYHYRESLPQHPVRRSILSNSQNFNSLFILFLFLNIGFFVYFFH